MSREARVGVAVFVALVLLSGLVFVTGGTLMSRKGYLLEATFPDAKGLAPGASVWVDGVDSGRVESLSLIPRGVLATLTIRKGISVPRDSRFSIETGGLLGEPFVHVRRGTASSDLAPGARAEGTIPPSLGQVMEEMRGSVAEIRATFSYLNEVLGDEETRKSLKAAIRGAPELIAGGRRAFGSVAGAAEDARGLVADTRIRIRLVGDRLALLSDNLNGVVTDNREEVRRLIANLRSVLGRWDVFLADFDPEGISGRDLKRAIVKVGDAAAQIESLTRTLEGSLSGDGGGNPVADLKRTVRQAQGVMTTLSEIQVKGEVGVHGVVAGQEGGNRALLDADLWIGRRSSPWGLVLGADDVGDDGGATAALGWRSSWVSLYGGVVRSDVGGGLRFDLSPAKLPLRLEGQWWDEEGGRWSAEGHLDLADHWSLYYKRVQGDPSDRESVGVSYRF
jgi:phospholipid/cholesterol/gamma-HCH transport system substrate-binding protein